MGTRCYNPNGVVAVGVSHVVCADGHNPVGVDKDFLVGTQGSRVAATLGFEAESLWDTGLIGASLRRLLRMIGFGFMLGAL